MVAHAKVLTKPERKSHRKVRHPETYLWVFGLENPHLYLNEPVIIDVAVRNQLEAFQARDPNKSWAWFVQATRRISQHDFEILIRH